MAKEKKAFPLRLDPELHRALEQWAADEFRSVNGHIEFLLREAQSKAGRLGKGKAPVQGDHDKDKSNED